MDSHTRNSNPFALTSKEMDILNRWGFQHYADDFEKLIHGLLNGGNNVDRLTAVRPAMENEFASLQYAYPGSREVFRRLGQMASERNTVALLLLNGGMATRYGSVVKGLSEAYRGKSFLELRMLQMWHADHDLLVLMNSFGTDRATQKYLHDVSFSPLSRERVLTFTQGILPRLWPDGTVYRTAEGEISCYGPGHGDLVESLRRNTELVEALRAKGVQYLLVANVDNLGATLDAEIVGYMLYKNVQCRLDGAPEFDMLVEVTDRLENDRGGAPVWVGDKLRLVEEFALPQGFNPRQNLVFNTNTLLISLAALLNLPPLTWLKTEKQVNGDTVVQFERIIGEASAHLNTLYLRVPRRERFLPVKSPSDLQLHEGAYARLFSWLPVREAATAGRR